VNTFLSERDAAADHAGAALIRSTEQEKQAQVAAVRAFQARHADVSDGARVALREAAASGGNLFAALLESVKTCSLGQITRALYEVGGQYRRSV
jgi:isobutyryl-CoA mutase